METWAPGVWYFDGLLMESPVGAKAVNMQEPKNPYVYALGDRATVWDGEMKNTDGTGRGGEIG